LFLCIYFLYLLHRFLSQLLTFLQWIKYQEKLEFHNRTDKENSGESGNFGVIYSLSVVYL